MAHAAVRPRERDGGSRQAIEGSAHEQARDKSGTMKPRHAAALALVGWYLMVPPIYDVPTATSPESVKIGDKFAEVRPSAPLGVWEVTASFDSADVCQAALYQMRDRMMKLWAKEAKEGKKQPILRTASISL